MMTPNRLQVYVEALEIGVFWGQSQPQQKHVAHGKENCRLTTYWKVECDILVREAPSRSEHFLSGRIVFYFHCHAFT